jgi:predicted ATP-grasp superfamily ATP-dependent carboligase
MYLSRKELADVVEQINTQFEKIMQRLEALENAEKERPKVGTGGSKRVQ